MEGLKANLISVSQLCDEGLKVVFTQLECQALDTNGKVVLSGIRSGNNCYMWQKTVKCLSAKNDVKLWHQKLGHMNVRNLSTLVKNDIVRGIPKLKGESVEVVCGPCKKGKQVKVQHTRHTIKSYIGSNSYGLDGSNADRKHRRKKYVFVIVDDYSRFTWVRFIRDSGQLQNMGFTVDK